MNIRGEARDILEYTVARDNFTYDVYDIELM